MNALEKIDIFLELKTFPSNSKICNTSPEGNDSLVSEGPHGAIHDSGVGLVQPTLLQHLTLEETKENEIKSSLNLTINQVTNYPRFMPNYYSRV